MDILICILSIMILTRPKVCRYHIVPDVTTIDNFFLLIMIMPDSIPVNFSRTFLKRLE